MTNEELKMLKDLYDKELEKRRTIHRLMIDDNVLTLFEMTNRNKLLDSIGREYSLRPEDIFYDIVKNFKLSGSSNIYFINLNVKDYRGKLKLYSNLENYNHLEDIKKIDEDIEIFEKEHDVLDPNNSSYQKDGSRVVQYNFFKESLENGQEIAKKKILEKYGN